MTYTAYPLPPITQRQDGVERHVGVEIEFAGLSGPEIADAMQTHLGGSMSWTNEFEGKLTNTGLGDFKLELDSQQAKEFAQNRADNEEDPGKLQEFTDTLVADIAQSLVPWEVVTPPLALSKLHRLDPLVDDLRKRGALGTRSATLYAFGVHLNPELPSLASETITAYLKAYICLHDWLLHHGEIDVSRRVTPYIDNFHTNYKLIVLAPDYQPGLRTLIQDYLEYNATRNRSLDMLPLFAFIDQAQVTAAIDDKRIGSRPTLHYRLPNCDIDKPDWSLRSPWRDWLQVEYLANDAQRLNAMCASYHESLSGWMPTSLDDWETKSQEWLVEID